MSALPIPHFHSSPGETLTRFISDRSHLRADGTVRHNAFQPPRSGRLSTFWISQLGDDEVWGLGRDYVEPHRGPILARAEINSLVCYAQGLQVELDGVPHPRHANVIGWKGSTEARLQAMKLAESSTVRRTPVDGGPG